MNAVSACNAGSGRARQPLAGAARVGLLLALVSLPATANQDYASRERALSAAFPGKIEVARCEVQFGAEAREALKVELRRKAMPERLEFYEVRNERGDLSGWALQRDVLGKSEPITYLVAFDTNKRVRSVEILAYRESHGGEVRREAFRKQFVGKGLESKLELGRDVRNISGATLSCRAITDGVHDDVLLLERALESGCDDTARSMLAPLRDARTAEDRARVHRARLCMGTSLEITVVDAPVEIAHAAIDAAFAEGERLDALLSHYREDSDISKIGRAAGSQAVEVHADTLKVLTESRRLHAETDGAFDPCIGALLRVWREASIAARWPSASEIDAARIASGMLQLELDPGGSLARLTTRDARIDLGGIGKGYALDRMGDVLRRNGAEAAILNFGGQVLALDAPNGSPGWRVEISAPSDRTRIVHTLCITRRSVATSSDSERGFRVGDRPISHILDPRTGLPATGTASATVCTLTATDADAWSTAVFVLGERALARAEAHGVAVLLQANDGTVRCNRSLAASDEATGEIHAAER
ncbi:MAG: FAD:protein FMN transferase [Planctomycetes bacterium]|nr:FAD:protein FMN transferase [Planctomycetota bacterium]